MSRGREISTALLAETASRVTYYVMMSSPGAPVLVVSRGAETNWCYVSESSGAGAAIGVVPLTVNVAGGESPVC